MLELQQRNLSAHPDRKLLKLNIDAGGVQSRKLIDKWIAQEQQAVATAAAQPAAAVA
jgi:vanillate O-demethylase monooxygenase subunit